MQLGRFVRWDTVMTRPSWLLGAMDRGTSYSGFRS
jgi:hypothetical protein